MSDGEILSGCPPELRARIEALTDEQCAGSIEAPSGIWDLYRDAEGWLVLCVHGPQEASVLVMQHRPTAEELS